jgi:hypothetical protein
MSTLRKRRHLSLTAVLIAGTMVAAQGPPRDQPPPQPAGTGVIRGRVVRADTGEPLRRVQIRVEQWSSRDLGGPPSTMTGDDGRYELTQLPAGSYHLKATRGGYADVAYGQRRSFGGGRPIELRDGQVAENINFSLPRGAVVTGRVVDEAGEAVAHVQVALARRQYIEGARRLTTHSGGSTDDRGEFRIFGAPPGDYLIVARFDASGFDSRERMRYVPTYYPGTASVAEAQKVTIATGEELAGITIALARASTATVRGAIRASDGGTVPPFTFVSARETGGVHAYGQTEMGIAGGDGSFAITGLLPGTYRLEARSSSAAEFASTDVVVDNADVTGVSLVLSKGVTARGRIRFDTGSPPSGLRPSQVLVMSSLLDQQSMSMSGGPPVARDDWSFELQGLRGRGYIRAATLADWQMRSIHLAGAEVTDALLDFDSDIDGLEVELTQRLTTVSGTVKDTRGRVSLEGTIIAFADDPGKWGQQSRFIESARPDQQGRFSIRGLPPGRYAAIAVDYLEPGEERDPELLDAWRQIATTFTLTEGETRVLDLEQSTF